MGFGVEVSEAGLIELLAGRWGDAEEIVQEFGSAGFESARTAIGGGMENGAEMFEG